MLRSPAVARLCRCSSLVSPAAPSTSSRFSTTPASLSSSSTPVVPPPPRNPALHRAADQHDITQMDLLAERMKNKEKVREEVIGGETVKWSYRSEVVKARDLDMNHRRIWIAFSLIIVLGFGSFVYVKTCVVLNRREEMEQREKLRRELKLHGQDRKQIGIVDN